MKTCPHCNIATIEDDEKFCQSCSKKIVQKAKTIIDTNIQHRNNVNRSDSLKRNYYIIFNGIILLFVFIFFNIPFSFFSIIFLVFLPVIFLSGNLAIRNSRSI